MHQADGRKRPLEPTYRCNKEYRAKSRRSDRGQSAVIWALKGEVVHGYRSLVCPKAWSIGTFGRNRRLIERQGLYRCGYTEGR